MGSRSARAIAAPRFAWPRIWVKDSTLAPFLFSTFDVIWDMERVLLEVKNSLDRNRLEEWLAPDYQILPPEPAQELAQPFDLAILDGPSLKRFRRKVRARRRTEENVLLPFLLLTVRRKGRRPTRHLGDL